MVKFNRWSAQHSTGCLLRLSSDQVLVVSFELCHCLFKNRTPHGLVFTRECEQSNEVLGAIFIGNRLQRQVIVNNNRVWNSKSIQVYSICSVCIEVLVLVDEETFKSARLLGNGASHRCEPTVTEGSLDHVLWSDAFIAPERILRELFADTAPSNTRLHTGNCSIGL